MAGISEKQQTDFTIDILASMVFMNLHLNLGRKPKMSLKNSMLPKLVRRSMMSLQNYGGMGLPT